MAYTKTNWNNNTAPYINATNLNHIEQGIEDNDTAVTKTTNIIGYDEYDSTSTYNVGDYCIYNNMLFKCLVAISTPEEFNSNHWDATSINEVINKVESDLATNTSGISTNRGLINTIRNNIGNMKIYYVGWGNEITFYVPIARHALIFVNFGYVFSLWNPEDNFHTTNIVGSGYSFSRDTNDKTKFRVYPTGGGQGSYTVVVF